MVGAVTTVLTVLVPILVLVQIITIYQLTNTHALVSNLLCTHHAITIITDINECTNGAVGIGINNGTDWCEQKCINTPGSYRCDCFSGYTLDANNKTCTGT